MSKLKLSPRSAGPRSEAKASDATTQNLKTKKLRVYLRDLRQTKQYADYMKQIGWRVERIKKLETEGGRKKEVKKRESRKKRREDNFVYVYIRKVPLLPISVVKIQRWQWPLDFNQLKRLCQRCCCLLLKLEPLLLEKKCTLINQIKESLKAHGFRQSSPLTPSKTIWIDLAKTRQELWRSLDKDARQSIQKAEGGVQIKILTEQDRGLIAKFYETWKIYGRGYIPKREDFLALIRAFGERGFLVTGWDEGELMAGAVILMSDEVAYYYFAMTTPKGRRKLVQYLVVWHSILKAKKRQLKLLDLEGIYDSRWPLKKWRGFSLFKKKFGGREVDLTGCYEKWLPGWR